MLLIVVGIAIILGLIWIFRWDAGTLTINRLDLEGPD
jgi:hypothetical protein